jgi:hypothetical protein
VVHQAEATFTFGKAPLALPKLSAIEMHLVRCEKFHDRASSRPSVGLVSGLGFGRGAGGR